MLYGALLVFPIRFPLKLPSSHVRHLCSVSTLSWCCWHWNLLLSITHILCGMGSVGMCSRHFPFSPIRRRFRALRRLLRQSRWCSIFRRSASSVPRPVLPSGLALLVWFPSRGVWRRPAFLPLPLFRSGAAFPESHGRRVVSAPVLPASLLCSAVPAPFPAMVCRSPLCLAPGRAACVR